MRLQDNVWNAISNYTRKAKLDDSFDIVNGVIEDYFYDYVNDKKMTIEEGLKVLAEALVYPLTNVGISEKEATLIREAVREYS